MTDPKFRDFVRKVSVMREKQIKWHRASPNEKTNLMNDIRALGMAIDIMLPEVTAILNAEQLKLELK